MWWEKEKSLRRETGRRWRNRKRIEDNRAWERQTRRQRRRDKHRQKDNETAPQTHKITIFMYDLFVDRGFYLFSCSVRHSLDIFIHLWLNRGSCIFICNERWEEASLFLSLLGHKIILSRNSLYSNLPLHRCRPCVGPRVDNEGISRWWFNKARTGRWVESGRGKVRADTVVDLRGQFQTSCWF